MPSRLQFKVFFKKEKIILFLILFHHNSIVWFISKNCGCVFSELNEVNSLKQNKFKPK